MKPDSSALPSARWLALLSESAQRSSALHAQFLHSRSAGLQGTQSLIEQQLRANFAGPPPELFSARQLEAFGMGRISDCLGPAFAAYDARRIPRIPNGDLRMMSRITAIEGRPRDFLQPASVVAEVDLASDAWFVSDQGVPVSILMEIALQPCGFLSAYLDTYALVPYEAFYFRNLDGWLRLVDRPPVVGCIRTQARLLSSIASSGTVIQKFAFALYEGSRLLAEGESTFGYFPVQTMLNQVGLDGGQVTTPWLRQSGNACGSPVDLAALRAEDRPGCRLARGRLDLLDSACIEPGGGRYGKGYLAAGRANHSSDWYYPFHFYQDPVMPGSLGVEAMLQAMQVYVLAQDLCAGLRKPAFAPATGAAPLVWRYRGQITPQHRQVELEVHIRDVQHGAQDLTLTGDSSLWIDGLRIYEVKNAAVRIVEM